MLTEQEIEAFEARGFVIVDNKPQRVKPGTVDALFRGTEECPVRWQDMHTFSRLLTKPFAYLVSDDHKRWRVWCPCVAYGLPVCQPWNERGLPQGVDLDQAGNVIQP